MSTIFTSDRSLDKAGDGTSVEMVLGKLEHGVKYVLSFKLVGQDEVCIR